MKNNTVHIIDASIVWEKCIPNIFTSYNGIKLIASIDRRLYIQRDKVYYPNKSFKNYYDNNFVFFLKKTKNPPKAGFTESI